MLPLELVTLILLLPIARALPQNSTTPLKVIITTTSNTINTGDPLFAHTESTASGFDILPTLSQPKSVKSTGTEQPKGPDKVHTENSVDGFTSSLKPQTTARGSNRVPHEENSQTDFEDPPARTAKPPTTRPPVNFPTVHTELPVSKSALEPGFKIPGAPLTTLPNTAHLPQPPNASPGPSTATPNTQQHQQQPNVPNSQPSQPPSAPDILNNIASKIFEQNSNNGPGPSQNKESPASNGVIPTVNGFDNPAATKNANPGAPAAQATPNAEATASPQANPVITLGPEVITRGSSVLTLTNGLSTTLAPEVVTRGSSVLTLTPGLSTTIGSGTLATFVAITTNTAGQTVVVISATGTRTSSTITSRPKTSSSILISLQVSTTGTAGPAGTTTVTPAPTTGQAPGRWHGSWSGCFTALVALAVGMAVLL